jgi:uncharacterized protein YbaR (Trm112 family)
MSHPAGPAGVTRPDASLLTLLVCPKCRGPLSHRESEAAIDCQACKLRYPILDGIPVLMVDAAQSLES